MTRILFNIFPLVVALMLTVQPAQSGGGGGGGDSDGPPPGSTPSVGPSKGPDGFQQSTTPLNLPRGGGLIFTNTTDDPANSGPAGTTSPAQGTTSPPPAPIEPKPTSTGSQQNPPMLPPNYIKNNIELINQARQQANLPPYDPAAIKGLQSGAAIPTMQALQGGLPPQPSQIDPNNPFGRHTPPAGALAGMGDPRAHSGPIDESKELENLELQARMMQHLASIGIAYVASPAVIVTYGVGTSVAGSIASGSSTSQTIAEGLKAGIYSYVTLPMDPTKSEAYADHHLQPFFLLGVL